jgi:hypothetical protein
LTYEEYNEVDIRRIMEKNNFPEGKISDVFHTWKQESRYAAIEKFKSFKRLVEFQQADK